MNATADATLQAVQELLGRSECLKAFDLVSAAVAGGSDSVTLRHRGVLALARMGAVARAKALFAEWGLDTVGDDEDVLALWGRLRKDEAQALPADRRPAALVDAAEAYRRAFDAGGGGYFPAINVASLNLFAGRTEEAQRWARAAMDLAAKQDDYYALATVAEAAIILRDEETARQALRAAVADQGASHAAESTTRRQLRALIDTLKLDPGILEPLAPPLVMHYCGHIVSKAGAGGRFPENEAARVAAEIARTIEDNRIAFAVGSLAAGADMLFAEAMIARGGELDIVLPFDREEFIELSVRPAGDGWVERFQRCLDAADDVHFVTEDAYLGDDELFNYASHFAMGLAKLRSRMLDTELLQIAVWDGAPAGDGDIAGTAIDLAAGRRLGLAQLVVPAGDVVPDLSRIAQPPPVSVSGHRQRRTMVFGDLKGFSKLSDAQLPTYVEVMLGACARVFDRYGDRLRFRNTWGDGLFLVFDDVAAAARCAFDLQSEITGIDRAASNLPADFGLRLGMHYGPVYEQLDPVLGRPNYFGYHVSRAARVEPIAPEGEVYVTEATAAALAVDAADEFRCDYVGRIPLAKGYGEFPMYALTRTGRG